MYRTVDEIIASSKGKEIQELAGIESLVGGFCDAMAAFIEIAAEWKTAFDAAVNIDVNTVRNDFFAARAVSLSLLATKALTAARDIPRCLLGGAMIPTIVTWRYVVEAKNIALLIDLDLDGKAGFLWLHYNAIEQAKVAPDFSEQKTFPDLAKRVLADAGFPYDSKANDPWAIGIDGNRHTNAIDRSKYIWKYRKFPLEVSDDMRSFLGEAEQKMIRASNALAHPTLTPLETMKGYIFPMMVTTAIDIMGVLLAYKAAASEVAGWPYRKTVGEQFHLYPPEEVQARDLSFMVKNMHDHCLYIFKEQFEIEE